MVMGSIGKGCNSWGSQSLVCQSLGIGCSDCLDSTLLKVVALTVPPVMVAVEVTVPVKVAPLTVGVVKVLALRV